MTLLCPVKIIIIYAPPHTYTQVRNMNKPTNLHCHSMLVHGVFAEPVSETRQCMAVPTINKGNCFQGRHVHKTLPILS